MYEKICQECGSRFLARCSRQKYCSLDCRMEHNRRTARAEYYRRRGCGNQEEGERMRSPEPVPLQEAGRPPAMDLEEVARRSRQEGLTYGQYVTKYGL